MSTQTVTVAAPTMMQILGFLLSQGYQTSAGVTLSCSSSTVAANVTNMTVQYAQGSITLQVVVSFAATCTGNLTGVSVQFSFLPLSGGGYGVPAAINLSGMSVPVSAGSAYNIYITETLTEPTTAQLQT